MKRNLFFGLAVLFLVLLVVISCAPEDSENDSFQNLKKEISALQLTKNSASHFARLALRCIQCEYPNKLDHVINGSEDVKNPKALHPAFYGCFDWHSSVHGHWMLVRLLKLFPDLPEAAKIRVKLNQNLTAENIAAEVAYLHQPNRKSFERTYGWAWLLKLAEELHGWDDADGKKWSENLQPLADEIVARYLNFLPNQDYPIRRGVHANTAFGIAFALDYARAFHHAELETLLVDRAKSYFFADKNCPASYEPGGDDFFSPCLMEADLMRRVLQREEFPEWLKNFLPQLFEDEKFSLMIPAEVADRSDPKIVHLDGLNLSRAWCLVGIVQSLPEKSKIKSQLLRSAINHANQTLPYIASGNYEGEHWLASFAVYFLSELNRVN